LKKSRHGSAIYMKEGQEIENAAILFRRGKAAPSKRKTAGTTKEMARAPRYGKRNGLASDAVNGSCRSEFLLFLNFDQSLALYVVKRTIPKANRTKECGRRVLLAKQGRTERFNRRTRTETGWPEGRKISPQKGKRNTTPTSPMAKTQYVTVSGALSMKEATPALSRGMRRFRGVSPSMPRLLIPGHSQMASTWPADAAIG